MRAILFTQPPRPPLMTIRETRPSFRFAEKSMPAWASFEVLLRSMQARSSRPVHRFAQPSPPDRKPACVASQQLPGPIDDSQIASAEQPANDRQLVRFEDGLRHRLRISEIASLRPSVAVRSHRPHGSRPAPPGASGVGVTLSLAELRSDRVCRRPSRSKPQFVVIAEPESRAQRSFSLRKRLVAS